MNVKIYVREPIHEAYEISGHEHLAGVQSFDRVTKSERSNSTFMSYTRKSLDQARRQDRVRKQGSICIRRSKTGSIRRKKVGGKRKSKGRAAPEKFDSWEGQLLDQSWLEQMAQMYPLRRSNNGKVTRRFIHITEFALKETGSKFEQLDTYAKKRLSQQFKRLFTSFHAQLSIKVSRKPEKMPLTELAKKYPLRSDWQEQPSPQLLHITQFALKETGKDWSVLSRAEKKSVSQRLNELRKGFHAELKTNVARNDSRVPIILLRVPVSSSGLLIPKAKPDANTRMLCPNK